MRFPERREMKVRPGCIKILVCSIQASGTDKLETGNSARCVSLSRFNYQFRHRSLRNRVANGTGSVKISVPRPRGARPYSALGSNMYFL